MEQDFLLIQDRLASRSNFLAMATLNELSGIPKSIEENSGRRAPLLTSLSGLQFSGTFQCPGIEINVKLNRSERKLRQLTILELFAMFDRDFIAF